MRLCRYGCSSIVRGQRGGCRTRIARCQSSIVRRAIARFHFPS